MGTAQIANGAVTGTQLHSGAVDTGNLATGAVDSAAIADNTVTGADLLRGTLTSREMTPWNGSNSLSGTFTVDPGSIPAGSCQSQAITSVATGSVSGVLPTDHVLINADSALPAQFSVGSEKPALANQLNVRFCNLGGSAADPGSTAFNFMVLR